MLKLFPMRHQLSHRRHPLHPSSIRDVRSLLRIRFLKSLNDLHVLSFLSSLLLKMGPKYRRECLPNETVLLFGNTVDLTATSLQRAPFWQTFHTLALV